MTPSRHVPLIAAVIAMPAGSRAAVAFTSDPAPAEGAAGATDDADAGDAPGEDAAVGTPMPMAFVEVSGGASGSLRTAGEATTTWRYGRARGLPVDEATSRLRVSGSGRTFDGPSRGLSVGFSVALLVPALRVGTYTASTVAGFAAAWARQDTASRAPEIEWDTTGRDAGPASFVVTVTSIAETSHSTERRGTVTVDWTAFRVHGSIDATLPCAHSVASLRQSCRPETIHGTF